MRFAGPPELPPWRPWAVVLGILGVVAVVVGGLMLSDGFVRGPAGDPLDYPVRGIDVSHHNGVIGWGRVRQANVDFVYIKATEGADFVDASFGDNVRGAARAGIPAGAYHFFTLCRPGDEQARNFLRATTLRRLRLAPAIDLEFSGNCAERPSRRTFNHDLSLYIDRVRKGTGREPILYVTRDFHRAYVAGGPFQRKTLWVRDAEGRLNKPLFSRVRYWQFDSQGRVNGIEGPVDLNAFLGDEAAFQAVLTP